MRFARTCYDHLAGHLGVAIADALVAKGHIVLTEDGGEVTEFGLHFLSAFGAAVTSKSPGRRIFCRPCLDWSERKVHLSGALGAAVLRQVLAKRCAHFGAGRVVQFTKPGLQMFGAVYKPAKPDRF